LKTGNNNPFTPLSDVKRSDLEPMFIEARDKKIALQKKLKSTEKNVDHDIGILRNYNARLSTVGQLSPARASNTGVSQKEKMRMAQEAKRLPDIKKAYSQFKQYFNKYNEIVGTLKNLNINMGIARTLHSHDIALVEALLKELDQSFDKNLRMEKLCDKIDKFMQIAEKFESQILISPIPEVPLSQSFAERRSSSSSSIPDVTQAQTF